MGCHTIDTPFRVVCAVHVWRTQKLLSELARAVELQKVEDEDECDATGAFRLVRASFQAGAAAFELRWSQERDMYGLVRAGADGNGEQGG